MSWLRRRAGPLTIIGSSALGGAAYRFNRPSDSSQASLNPHTFTSYTLVDKKLVSSSSAIFTLRNQNAASDPQSLKNALAHSVWSVQIKQPQLQIARAYTPLPPTLDENNKGDDGSQDIRLLIRQEEGGEVSTYLHRLPEQTPIELRGPHVELELPDDIKEVIFLAGGTGIAPAMQVAHMLKQRSGAVMHILWANRRREECLGGVNDNNGREIGAHSETAWWKGLFGFNDPTAQALLPGHHNTSSKGVIVKELNALKGRNEAGTTTLNIQYYVDEEQAFIQPGQITKILAPRLDAVGSRVIIVSGPTGFLDYWAGKKIWVGGREEQGPLRGVLGRLDLGNWKVVKL